MDWGDSSSGSSSLTVGERICAAFIPFIALVEVLIFAVGNCLDYKPRTTNKISPEYRDLARFADESPFTVNEVEALYELYKKLSNSIIKDGLIHKEELQLALFRTPHGENLFLDWASAQVHRPLEDKASRAFVLYGDGFARFVNSGHTHLHSLASKATCGFLSLPNAPPSESEDERIFRVCSSVAPSESCDDKSLQSNALLPTISERYF